MKLVSSFLFASRLLFPRTGKKSNARKSLIGACLCIGISLVPLVVVMTVSNGMIQGITERIIGLSTSHIQIDFYDSDELISDPEYFSEISEIASCVDGVKNVYPEIQGIGLASSLKGRAGASIRAVKEDSFEKNLSFKKYFDVVSGVPDLSSKNSVVLCKKLASDLGVDVGKTIRLITTKEISGGKTVPKITPLKVSAIVSSGYQELDALWLFLSLETGSKIMSASSSQAILGIETENAFGAELEKTYRNLSSFRDLGRIYKWNQLNTSQFENYASTQIMLVFIMMLIVLVASVNISSALVMLVIERKKEIAIIKSLGGTSEGIAFSFILTGFFTGLAGVLAGIPAGILCAVNFNPLMSAVEKAVNLLVHFWNMIFSDGTSAENAVHLLDPAFYLQNVPLSIPLGQLFIVASGTLILSLFVSAVPALKAGKEKPIETLKKI